MADFHRPGSRVDPHPDIRCSACHSLLARRTRAGVCIVRGDLQTTVNGDFEITLVCYRRDCRTVNVLQFPESPSPRA